MPQISVSVPRTGAVLSYEVVPEMSVGTLKEFISAETAIPTAKLVLYSNGVALTNDTQTLGDAGVEDNDMLAADSVSEEQLQQRSQPARPSPAVAPPNPSQQAQLEREADRIREQALSNPQIRGQLMGQAPELASVIDDQARFREVFIQHMQRMQTFQRQRQAELDSLDNDVTSENQAKIMEHIRQQNVEREYYEVMSENPEFFAKVTMLYINVEVNGHPVKAFVDSGAQATIMSPSCADACNVTRLIDKRFSGVAHGVGTAKILGRVHRASVRVGDAELPCSFTVMEGKDVDMLFGLDMLKRYQACIDLDKNVLRFQGGVSVPFLPESEIPRSFEEAINQEPTVTGPGGAEIGAESGAVKQNPSTSSISGPATASTASSLARGTPNVEQPSSSPSGGLNIVGHGRRERGEGSGNKESKAAAAAAASSSSSSQPAASNRPARPAAPTPAQAAPPFPQSSIDMLQSMGATRDQAIEALRVCDGNLELAASYVLGL